MNSPRPTRVLRVLLYEGSEKWIENTLKRSAVQKGVWGVATQTFSIQEVTLPVWLSWLLAWLAKRQPMARIGFVAELGGKD